MTSSNDSVPPTTVAMTFSQRDLAYLMGAVALHRVLHNAINYGAPNAFVQHNVDALEIIYEDHYSANEANELTERLKVQFVDNEFVTIVNADLFRYPASGLVL